MPLTLISGPRDAGPGEREQMLSHAARIFEEAGIADHVRIDVPGRASGDDVTGQLRESVHPVVPALQSGSLFGDRSGLLVVDTQQLQKGEAEVIAELVEAADPDQVVAVFVAEGSVPAPLSGVLRSKGDKISVNKLRERDASAWLGEAARERRIRLESGAATVLLQRFGTDVAALGRALDQLAVDGSTVSAEDVAGRFTNRPDEPLYYLSDAIAAGQEGEALRRLEDFLEHGHPLVLLSFLEGVVRRRSLAAVAPDLETYASWVKGNPKSYPVRKVWDARSRSRSEPLHRSLDALTRADLTLKTEPEVTHRITLERLTVALCRWLGK
jgi:DNA polymerase III delta subunit